MDIFLLIIAILLALSGLVGSVLPILPGPPLSYAGLLVLHFTSYANYSTSFLVITAVIAIIITALDYVIPLWGTKTFGGTKAGKNGALIGILAGLFIFPPFGIIIGPFVGAFIGELTHDSNDFTKAIKSGIGSFIGFLLGTGIKLMFGLYVLYKFIKVFLNAYSG